MTEELMTAARAEIRRMDWPSDWRSVYPALHGAANRIGGDYAQAVGAVFKAVCEVCGTPFGKQYMSNVIEARFRDGSLIQSLKAHA